MQKGTGAGIYRGIKRLCHRHDADTTVIALFTGWNIGGNHIHFAGFGVAVYGADSERKNKVGGALGSDDLHSGNCCIVVVTDHGMG